MKIRQKGEWRKALPQKEAPSFFRTKREGDFRSTLKMNNINS
ncbi:hypothetical protein POREN0001_0825 [Porphyromonas endodontalis ATCC 35406]|uniref:Uncharacterized protein n=1 Tax=Porphyromonas endodontalis (strain ATCC 35406 / DSM 24491 / JCM 8526 / CCUG 16442 / BCRC 14492 / NCTC 13058 / HG 370) TaxID=553175 RepID=C3J9S4_POREA|nr:hypothetical protein POREN0001_0825 [Porphyromonas endodontalis ATCC 35406]